jgi:hypothetical protein
MTIAEAPHPAGATTIEILRGKHAGVYRVHPLAVMLPRIEGAAREELQNSLRRCGQQEPAVVAGAWFLDGRNRVEIMNDLGQEPIAVQFASLKTKLSPEDWIVMKHLARRDLTDDQRLAFVANCRAWLKRYKHLQPTARMLVVASASAAQTQTSTIGHAPESRPAEYPPKPADNAPNRKPGRPPGMRSEAKALAAAAEQTRYRAEGLLKLRDQAPDLAEAVGCGTMKLKAALAQLKMRCQLQPPIPPAAPVNPPNADPARARVASALKEGMAVLREIIGKHEFRRRDIHCFWNQISLFAQCRVARDVRA